MWIAPCLTSGLGNRLFQFAAAAGAAERWGRPVVFYMPACEESPHGAMATIFRLYPTIPLVETPSSVTPYQIREPQHRHYEYIPLGPHAPVATPILLHGFRQSPAYFPTTLPEPDWDSALGGPVVRRALERDAALHTEELRADTVAIHVRLGDYRKLAHHQIDLAHYYTRALQRVPVGSRLHLFSDEPDLCRHIFEGAAAARGLHFTSARVRSDIESLYEMSLCRGGTITANSTFSWWGAWFAHKAGAPWATYPESMGQGMPEPVDYFPSWGTVLSVKPL